MEAHYLSLTIASTLNRIIPSCNKQSFANTKMPQNSSIVLITVCEKLITIRDDEKQTLNFIHDYLESRLALLRTVNVSNFFFATLLEKEHLGREHTLQTIDFGLQELADITEDIPERATACTKLETAFLVSLCSTDISVCQLVTKCISLFCNEAHLVGGSTETNKALVPTLRNLDIYWTSCFSKAGSKLAQTDATSHCWHSDCLGDRLRRLAYIVETDLLSSH